MSLTNSGPTIKILRIGAVTTIVCAITKYFWSPLAKIRGKEEVNHSFQEKNIWVLFRGRRR